MSENAYPKKYKSEKSAGYFINKLILLIYRVRLIVEAILKTILLSQARDILILLLGWNKGPEFS